MSIEYKMSLFDNLDQYLLKEILRRAKSYYLNRSVRHLIEDKSLKKDIDKIGKLHDEARNIVSKLKRISYTRDKVNRLRREGKTKTNLFKELQCDSFVFIDRKELNSLLSIAIKREFIDLIDELVYDILWCDIIGKIIEDGNLNLLKYVFEKLEDDTSIALHSAVLFENVEIIEWILKNDDYIGEDSIFTAIKKDNVEVLKVLLRGHSKFDIEEEYVNYAAKKGSLNCLKELINRKGDQINVFELLDHSIQKGNLKVVEYIVERFGITQLNNELLTTVSSGDIDIVKYLIERGADNIKEAIYEAISCECFEIIDYLMKRGAYIISEAIQETMVDECSELFDYLRGL